MQQPGVGKAIRGGRKRGAEAFGYRGLPGPNDQRVTALFIDIGERAYEIADVRADSEIANTADVDDDVAHSSARRPPVSTHKAGSVRLTWLRSGVRRRGRSRLRYFPGRG